MLDSVIRDWLEPSPLRGQYHTHTHTPYLVGSQIIFLTSKICFIAGNWCIKLSITGHLVVAYLCLRIFKGF